MTWPAAEPEAVIGVEFTEDELLVLWFMVNAIHEDKGRVSSTMHGDVMIESLWRKFETIREAIPSREPERPVA